MKADSFALLRLMSRANLQFQIPIFQREYCWDKNQCEQLWKDIMNTGGSKNIPSHFIGTIVIVEEEKFSVSTMFNEYLIIDGQQRLTTVALLLEVLARCIDKPEINAKIDPAWRNIRDTYLNNPNYQNHARYHRLTLGQNDQETLNAILEKKEQNLPFPSKALLSNFQFFVEKVQESRDCLEQILAGIAKLRFVEVDLKPGEDDPQLIFESLNSTGRRLNETDLIRNFILMGLSSDCQKKFYTEYWHPMEKLFPEPNETENKTNDSQFKRFFRDYVTVQNGEIPNLDRTYEEFKYFYQDTYDKKRIPEVEQSLRELFQFAEYYATILGFPNRLGREIAKIPALDQALRNLRQHPQISTILPFLMKVFDLYTQKELTAQDFTEVVSVIESYIFRRAVCKLPTNILNQLFSKIFNTLDRQNFMENLRAKFSLLTDRSRFPTDDEFQADLVRFNLYSNAERCKYVLFRLENLGQMEQVSNTSQISIEHVLPQKIQKVPEWKMLLGDDWENLHKIWLHTIGNLTLTGYNSTLSNAPFDIKLPEYQKSRFHLTKNFIANQNFWNIETIQERAKLLAKQAVQIWKYPEVGEEIRSKYRLKRKRQKPDSINQYEFMSVNSPTFLLYEHLHRAVMERFPELNRELMVCYIVYKARKAFFSVIPLKASLALVVNVKFADFPQTSLYYENVAAKGHHGTGEVRMKFSHVSQLDEVLRVLEAVSLLNNSQNLSINFREMQSNSRVLKSS